MIPLSTTTIAVWRATPGTEYDEPYGGAEPYNREILATGVRAVIDSPAGFAQLQGGQQNVARYRLICDETDLNYLDLVQDEGTGRHFIVQWLHQYFGDHIEAGLYDTEGEV